MPAFAIFPPFEFNFAVARKIAPLTFVYLSMIVFNNLCLKYVQVSFYQVARSLTVLWTALFTYILLGKTVSKLRLLSTCVVFIGFVIGSKGEVNFDIYGLIFGILACMFVALYGIYVKKALADVQDDQWRLLIYNTTLAIIMLFPFVLFSGEFVVLTPWSPIPFNLNTWILVILTGVVGWLINIAIFMQIKYTSPLTNAISGTVKAAVQTLMGVVFFNDQITWMNFYGIVIVIGGSFWYGRISYQEGIEEKARILELQRQEEELRMNENELEAHKEEV